MRKKKNSKLRSALAIFLAGAMVLGMIPGGMGQVYASDSTPTPAVAFDETSVSDPSTVDTWNQVVKDSTENIGRIWTDKTVLTEDIQLEGGSRPSVKKGDSDFLVGLSALSSTSNTVKTVSRPLDIVLVVDTSGSMENSPHMGTRPESERYRYEEIYAGNLSETEDQEYYTKDGGKITSEGQKILFWWEFTHWELNGQTVEPKISAEDSNPNHIQFYERRDLGTNITKLQALQNAVNNFVEQTAKMNDSIDDIKLQHRVSLVKFASDESDNIGNDFINNNYNRSQIVTELKSYTTKNISDLTSTVNSLIAAGATRADFGLNQAQRAFQLGGTREGAQKVVVFFTDGQPTSNSDWSNSVAAAAITNAKELKDANALIYSIGVFRDANPNDTNTSAGNFNGYMHAVSSNYPDATAISSTRPNRYSCTLGKRTDNSDYYKAATDADELNNIFNEISSDLETGFGFPTQTEGYDPGKVGYITFTDQLGEYMQVDEFKSLVFADQIFDPVGEPVTENGVTTYKYEGSATGDTELYPNGNVKDIIVQVKKGADLKTGDTVTVQIPAGLIPLRHFTLDTDSDGNKTLDIQEAYPLRIFYGVSIKPEVRKRIADGLNPNDADDEALQQYLNAHNENGVPYFYSNYYNGQYIDPNGKTLGNTTASFQPAKKNTFYYFTEDTPIYTDKDCTMAVKNEPSADQTYYYKRPYVQLNGGQVEEIDGKVAFTGSNFQQASANFGINDKGEYFIKSGSARLTRIDALIDDKTENITNTADVVIDPIWDNINNPDYLNVYLGNNGRLALELPGALAISKDARVAANKNLNADEILKDKKFTFEISIPSMKGKTVKAEVRNAQNEIQGKAFELEFDKTGAAKYQIKDDETLYIHGLDKDAQYTVTEKELPKGFELTAVDKKADAKEAAGTIVSGKSVKHVFENTYDVDEITLAETDFASYEKQFDRWDIADKFRIELIPTTEGAPLPNGAADGKKGVEVTEKNSSGNFGEITFSHPGVYEYEIQEKQPASAIPGVIYSLASYTYRVTVTDNGDGTLSAVAEMEKTANDDGASVGNTPIPVENKTAVFVNDFHADSATTSILAKKVYADESGANPLKNGMFEFKLKATGDNAEQAPMPTGEKDENGYIHVVNVGTGITFGNMVFTEENVSDTPWTYEIAEVIPETAVNNGDGTYTLNGITYKAQTYSVSIMAKAQGSGEDAYIVIEKTYSKAEGAVAEDQVVFNNSYEPKPIVLPGEGESAVQGRKTLVGRDSLVDEEFSFTLSAANTAARTGLKENFIIFNGDTAQDTMQKTVNGLTNNQAATFDFDSIEFKRPGTYVFSVVENAPENGNGMVYDRHTARVRVIVTDENGELKAETAYYNGEGADTDAAAFVNLYTASATYGTGAELIVEKTLSGRALKAGEFTFKIEAADSDTVNAETADAKLSDSDREFTNTSGAADGVASRIFDKLSGVTFTQDDAGKTFSYVLSEAAGNLPGVTYSKDTYRFDITVVDNGDGTMHTETKVTMQGDGVTAEAHHDSSDGRDTIVAGFTNGYHADSVEVDFTEAAALFHKRLVGRDWKEDDSFTFNLTAEDGTPMPKDTEGNDVTSVTVSQKGGTEDGTDVPFGFGKVTYDTVGKYSYTVTEENAGQTINGVTYSKNEAKIIVDVSDPGNGQLTANIQSYSTIFINEYGASLNLGAAGGLAITKTVTGHALAKEQFEFKVKAVKTDTATADEAAELFGFKEGETEVTFKNNEAAADGQTVTMLKTDTNFTLKNLGKVYKYEVSEMNDKKPGYTYDDTVYTVELWVTDDGDGTLTLHTKVTDEKGSVISEETSNETDQKQTVLAFNNSYAGSGVLDGSANLAGTKKMDGPWEATDKDLSGFRFTITGGDEATNAAITAGTVVLPQSVTATSDADGNFNFGDITFNEKGTYKFTVSEVVPAEGDKIPGVAYNAETVTIIVNVTDNDDGTLTAALAEGSQELIFTNTYATTQDATFTPSVVKEVKGLNAKEIFTFKLSAADEATKAAIDSGTLTGIGTTADLYSSEKTTTKLIPKDGTEQVDFNALTFKKAGTYKFTVQETNANAPTGWTYDSHTYEIIIKVTDQDSVLKATQEINADGVTNSQIFINKFEASTTYGDEGGLNVTKTLNGRTLAADMFDFTITGEATDSVTAEEAEAKLAETDKSFKNTAPGKDDVAVMSKLSDVKFDETDIGKTYQYSVREAAGTDTKYTYDQVSATVAITVQEKDGELYTVTTVTKGDDSKEYSSAESKATAVAPFVNSYTPDIVTIEPGAFAGKVTKVLKGNRDTGLAAGEFNFQMKITPADDTSSMDNVVLSEGAVGDTITSANAADGSVSFGNIQFKAAGNYHVEITEVVPEYADPNMTYDKHTFSYDIAVTYNAAEGTLSAKVADGSQAGSATFTNIYEAEDAKDVINTEEPSTSVNGKIVGVGDQLTYTIDWVNNAVDETGAPAKAEVKITDIVPKGTEYVSADTNGVYEETSKTITWTLGEQEAGAFGTVSFVVKVLDSAGGTAVENTAEITIGDNDPNQTNTVTTNVPGKDSVVEGDGELQVGKVLTYTISYKNPEIEAATVIITDSIPEGLDYVDDSAGEYASYNAETRMLTWKIADVQPGADGTVTFDARVNESAETVVENKATIQIGENGPEYETDTDRKEIPKDGNLSISKTIVLTEGQGTGIDKEKEFTFIVALKDAKGTALTKEYAYAVTGESGEEIKKGNAADGTEISFQHGQKAVITGLPAGAQYTVTEKEVDGYTTTVNGNAGNAASGTITSNTTAEANFTNTYSVAGSLSGSEALKVTKELTGRKWLDTDTFSYTLTAADEATVEAIENGFITLPENAGGLEITKASAGHQAAFGDIQFTIAGTFKFNVTEQPSGIAGITDDQEAERTVVVKVTDKKNGTLEAAVVEGESENLTFINTYGAGTGDEDIAAKIEASKKLTGRDMKANEFRFEIVTRAAENPEGFKETFAAAGTNTEAAEGAEGAVKFAGNDGALTYTTESLDQAVKDGYAVKSENDDGSDVWTVSYTAREITDKLPGGVTAVEGKTSFDFTVVVTDRTDGTLTAQVQLPEGGIVFENAYTAEDTEVNTDPADAKSYFNKVLTGRSWLGTDEFTFTITPQDGAPAAEDAAADGMKTVTVTSDSAKAGEAVLFGFGKIRFTDEDMNGAAAGQDGTRTKEFRYTVKENPLPDGKMTGVTIDGHEATLKITVSDNLEGKLEVTNIASENGTFTNEYKSQLDYAAAGGLQITKALNGRDMEKDQFTFTVTPKATEGSTTAEEAAEKFGLANAANTYKNEAAEAGAVTTINVLDGKNVTFTQADAGKTFTYEAAETAGTNTAYTYDTDVRTVTVKVKDNNNSTLTVTTRVTKVKDGQEVIVDEQEVTTGEVGQKKATISFVNTYNDEPVELGGEGSVKINATKTLANRPLTDGEFTFRIFDKKGNPVVGKDAEATGTNAADGSITFAPVSYDTDRLMADVKAGIASVDKKSQAPAYVYTYDYTVTEDNPSGGVTGIATTFAIQVIVTDRGDGTLAIEVKYPDGKDSLPFENVYGKSANAEIALNGKKVYEKESVNAPDIAGKYTFTITGTDELGNPAPMPVKDGKVVTETTNDAAGNIDFGKLVYTMENVFGSAESQDEQTNANQDVEAGEDPADTNQNAEAGQDPAAADTAEDKTAAEDAADAAENAASEETAGDGTEGTKAPETDETDIEANGGSNAGSSGEDQDKEAAGAASADGGNVVDQAGTMNAQEAGQANRFSEPRTKVYTYRVTESGSMAGVTNDLAAAEGKTFTVTVTDNGDGTISAVSSWQNDFAFEFTNTYRVNPTDYSVNEHISIKKELTGRDLHEGEFTFELIDESGNVVASAVNEADGTVRFGALHYTEAGTYNYVIREVEGTAGGVQYDSAEHTVTVIVTDNGDGTLSAKAETKSGEDMNGIVFRNIYEARPASVTLGASKTYKGAELKDKQFTFVLKDKDGNVVFEAKNGADGQVMFETLIYDRAGVYEYTISEKNDGQKNVTYDETVYNVTITVTDNGKGNLIAEAVYGDGRTPQFVNTYVKPQNPVKPEQPTPTVKPQNPGAVQTGDHNSFAGTLGMAALALAVAAGVMIRRKKKS